MSDKVKGFGRRGAENIIAEAKLFGAVSCAGGCGASIKVTETTDLCRAFNFFQFDHIVAKSNGGSFERSNCATLCGSRLDANYRTVKGCNQRKGNTASETFYTPEAIERIKAIQSVEVTETEWQEFKIAFFNFNPETDFCQRFPPSKS
jgi:hypothetical protein